MKRLLREKPAQLLSLRFYLLRFLIGALLGANQLYGGYAPFALGFVAAMGPGSGGLSALAGVLAGAALFMDFSRALRCAAVGVLVFSARSTLSDTRAAKKPLFFPVLTALLMGSVEVIYLITGGAAAAEWAEGVTAAVLAGLSVCYFPAEPDFRRLDTPKARLSHLTLLAALCMSLTAVPLPWGMSLGRVLGGGVVMLSAFRGGPAAGAAVGLGVGLGMDLRLSGPQLFFSAAYALGGFFLGFRRESGRVISAILYCLVSGFFLLPFPAGSRWPLAEEAICSAVLFLALPLGRRGGKYLRIAPEDAEPSPSDQLRAQLEQAAMAFRELYDSFARTPADREENPSVLFDRVAVQLCGGCTLCDVCWKRDYTATFNAFNDATPALLRRGRAEARDFPSFFSSRCIHFSDFLAALNTELTAYLLRRQYRARLGEARRSARGQYAQLSDLLSGAAADLPESAVPAAKAAALIYQVGAAIRPKKGEAVSGDSLTSFESENGASLFLLLSDGMGCGAAARGESATAIRLLERFLKAGIQPEAALKTVNAAFSLRSADSGSFTTIDLLALNLRSADATLYKYGAAPSYLKQGGQVRRITGGSLPAGLESDAQLPDATRLHLEPGSFLVLLSDGLAESADTPWITALLQDWHGQNPQSLVSLLLADSLSHGGELDDCAVLVLYLPKGEAEV